MINRHLSKTVLLGLSVIFFTFNSYSQILVYNIPLDKVKQFALKNQEYLMLINKKVVDPDSSVLNEEYFDLYYGSAYLENYSPYFERTSAVATYELLKEGKYLEAIELSKNQLLSNPGFVRPLYFLGIAYDKLGDSIKAEIYFNRFYEFLSIPFFSGNGKSPDSAYVVRSIDDEYLIVGELGYETESQALIFNEGIPFDILYVKTEMDSTSHEVYFNIAQPYLLGLNFTKESDDRTIKDKKKERKKKNSKER